MAVEIMEDRLAVDIRKVRMDLSAAYRLAARAGYDDVIWNHFSVRVPGRDDRFLVKPHGLTFDEVTASSLVVVDNDGRVVEGDGYVEESAFQLHAQIHRTRANAACALHAHPPYATALTSLRDNRLRFVHQDSLHFYGRVAYHEGYHGLALDAEEAAKIVGALAEKDVLFMRHHGVIVVGRDVADAYYHLYYLELAARRQLLAMGSGLELVDIAEDIAELVGRQFEDEREESAALNFAALKRRLDREDPGYAE
jgi:ribulose-5-phosphate 4-epimerase/fuculose-1-phosphate aldolase